VVKIILIVGNYEFKQFLVLELFQLLLTQRINIWNVIEPGLSLKTRPERRGVGCLGRPYWNVKAGSPFLNHFIVSLLQKIQLFKYQVYAHANYYFSSTNFKEAELIQ